MGCFAALWLLILVGNLGANFAAVSSADEIITLNIVTANVGVLLRQTP